MEETQFQAFTVRVPLELHLAARIKSAKTRKSINEVLNERLADWVREKEEPATQPGKAVKGK